MADNFLILGIIFSVILSDAIVCLGRTLSFKKKLDDDLYLLPALFVNGFGFVMISVYNIYEIIVR